METYHTKMTVLIFMSFLCIINVCVVNGQSCNTPSGAKGECISIYDCEPLYKLVENPNRTPQQLELLQSSRCSSVGQNVAVCCPPECLTPEGRAGTCKNISSCPHIANRLRKPVSQENRLYVQKSKCEGPGQFSVCCGLDTITPMKTKNNLNTKCTAEQSAFPPDPRTDCCGYDSTFGNKIFGGKPTSVDMYPWLGIIEYERVDRNKAACGGALISGRYFLTAAHCVNQNADRLHGAPTAVRLGDYDITKDGRDCSTVAAGGQLCTTGEVTIKIEKVIIHPEHNTFSRQNDIALIRLNTMAPFTEFIRPICLPRSDITLNPPAPENFTLYAAGWGSTDEYKSTSNLKLHVDLPYVDVQNCQRAFDEISLDVNIWDRQICAGGETGKDTCKGDSGGPLMFKNGRVYEALGIVSYGAKPCANGPGVYTKVSSYLNWIVSNISN